MATPAHQPGPSPARFGSWPCLRGSLFEPNLDMGRGPFSCQEQFQKLFALSVSMSNEYANACALDSVLVRLCRCGLGWGYVGVMFYRWVVRHCSTLGPVVRCQRILSSKKSLYSWALAPDLALLRFSCVG